MGMPGSQTASEELVCRVLGDLIHEKVVAKIADDLYCGANSPEELLQNWKRVLHALSKCNLKLSTSKTVIIPKSTVILGWIWDSGILRASPRRIAALVSCSKPETVGRLKSFIVAYKVLAHVIPQCSALLSPLDTVVAGRLSHERINWSNDQLTSIHRARFALSASRSISLPRLDDQLCIITDGAVKTLGIGATLYVTRNNKLQLAGFFSAKLLAPQVTWLPCEIEALSISATTKHFSPYIIQSKTTACILTDSNLLYSPLKSYVVVSFPQARVLLLSSPLLVDTKPLFVMLLELQSYLLTLRVAMLPSVTTQLAKFAASFNVLRIPWFSAHLSKAYCQELLNFLSLAELLGLLSRQSVQTYGALMPILLKAHALPRS